MEPIFDQILAKLESIEHMANETKSTVDRIEQKLDATFEQVVRNSEADSEIKETVQQLSATVSQHDIDIKLIKKVVSA